MWGNKLLGFSSLTFALPFRFKLYVLEKKCFTGMEKLKVRFGDYQQDGIPISHILVKTKSILTPRKPLPMNNGYSKCSRYILSLFTDTEEDLAPLCSTNTKVLSGL